ncbi:MAG TPA: fatty acid--CoA ligase family protein [Fontimonas sp.]
MTAAMNLQDMTRQALARDPARPALEFGERWYSVGELRRLAGRLEQRMAQAGIDDRAAVTFVPRNCPEAVAALLALLAAGRTIRMVYAFQSTAGIARDVARLRSSLVIAGAAELADDVLSAARGCGAAAIRLDDMDARLVPGLERCEGGRTLPAGAVPEVQILTSGTTGAPKQFPIAHELIARHHVEPRLAAATADEALREPPALLFFPLGNISGIYSTLPAVLRGQRVVLLERYTLDAWRRYIREHRPAASGGPPAAVQMILDAAVPVEELASLQCFATGAAPLDPTVQQSFEARYRIPILLSYGATEFGGPVCAMTPALHAAWAARKPGTVGRAMPGVQLRVVDADSGAELPPGREGLLEVITPRLDTGWIRTADIGVIDEDGFLFLRGRADGAITRGGFKLLPETIERALLRHPAIAEAAVVGLPDRRLGQIPAAAIRLKPGSTAPGFEALEAHLRQHVLATHIPVRWTLVAELPKNASMKIDRRGVAQLFDPA